MMDLAYLLRQMLGITFLSLNTKSVECNEVPHMILKENSEDALHGLLASRELENLQFRWELKKSLFQEVPIRYVLDIIKSFAIFDYCCKHVINQKLLIIQIWPQLKIKDCKFIWVWQSYISQKGEYPSNCGNCCRIYRFVKSKLGLYI